MTFFEGALLYSDIKTMSLTELLRLQEVANKISQERDNEIKKARHGK